MINLYQSQLRDKAESNFFGGVNGSSGALSQSRGLVTRTLSLSLCFLKNCASIDNAIVLCIAVFPLQADICGATIYLSAIRIYMEISSGCFAGANGQIVVDIKFEIEFFFEHIRVS